MDELGDHERLLGRHDKLWLDTTTVLADYLPSRVPPRLLATRPERILDGTDLPNLPHAWDRELKKLREIDLREQAPAMILGGSASELCGLSR